MKDKYYENIKESLINNEITNIKELIPEPIIIKSNLKIKK